jgi:hypothetical protein
MGAARRLIKTKSPLRACTPPELPSAGLWAATAAATRVLMQAVITGVLAAENAARFLKE